MDSSIDHRLRGLARLIMRNEAQAGVLSSGERIAVALVLDRADLFPRDYTMLDAVGRVGPEWTAAALRVQRAGLECEELAHE